MVRTLVCIAVFLLAYIVFRLDLLHFYVLLIWSGIAGFRIIRIVDIKKQDA